MTKREFLSKLKTALGNDLSGAVISENVNYYNQYISDEVAKGRSEEEVTEELGDPWAIARTIIDATENQEYTEGEYRSESGSAEGTSEYDYAGNNGHVHVFGLDSWWKKLLLVLGIVGILLIIVSVVGGIISLLAPILVPLLLVMCFIRMFNGRRR